MQETVMIDMLYRRTLRKTIARERITEIGQI